MPSRRPKLLALGLVAVVGLTVASCAGKDTRSSKATTPPATATTAVPPASATTAAATTPTTAGAAASAVIDPGDGGNYAPQINPADFVEVIDNPYMPLKPGSSWTYLGAVDGEKERVQVVVKPERRTIMGISAVVVRDTVFDVDDEPIEVTTDWYAQDKSGNVWYLGEDSKEYENGKLTSTKGSWQAGVKGAKPGIIMLAAPTPGKAYRQEYYRGEAEDMAEVVRVGATASVAAGRYDKLVVTREWTPLEPKVIEEKYYAAGIGNVLEVQVAGGRGRVGLVEFTPGRG